MFPKVLIPLDGSRPAEATLIYAARLAQTVPIEEVVVLMVIDSGGTKGLLRADNYLEQFARRLATATTTTSANGVSRAPCIQRITTHAMPGQAATTIIQFAEDNFVRLIMLTSRGRSGLDRWRLGSVAEKVLLGTGIPVFLIPSRFIATLFNSGFKRILVPLDGSDLAEQALPYVKYLAKNCGSEAVLQYVQSPPIIAVPGDQPNAFLGGEGQIDNANTYLSFIACRLASSGIKARTKLTFGHSGREIAREAIDAEADLLVTCTHGRSGLAERPFCGVTDQVLRTSPVPVLLVRASLAALSTDPPETLTTTENWATPSLCNALDQ